MKKLFPALLCLALTISLSGQNFTWIKGTNTISAPNIHGIQGVSSPSNSPGQRHGCAKWVDNNGNLWFFGGEAQTGSWWNDLWKYNIATNEWTWIRGSNNQNSLGNYGTIGVPSSTNDPGAREFSACWTDNSGNFWLFGGTGFGVSSSSGKLSDLWKYNPATNEWTWMKGPNTITQAGNYGTQGVPAPTNMPGGREESAYWKDVSGNLWLFGGVGQFSLALQGRLNDLWKYDIATNNWTWINGSNGPNPYGVYGTVSVASATNHPGGRFGSACWRIGSDLYLFGGLGRDSTSSSISIGALNDLWKYSPATNAWTWLGGSPFANPTANYGTLGVSSPLNIPGPRESAASWVDAHNNVWLFGGINTATSSHFFLNDLFKYNTALNEWTWMKGSNLTDQNGTYGTMGVPAGSNIPGARGYSTFWTDVTNKFWLLGGEGFDATNSSDGHMNDLWSYTIPCNPDSIMITPGKVVCSGTHATLTAINGGNTTVWYPSATSTSSISGGGTLALSSLTTSASQTVFSYYAEANSCTTAPRASITITVNPLPTIASNASPSVTCPNTSVALSATGASTYTWNTTPAQTGSLISVLVSSMISPTYIVTGTDQNGCVNSTSQHIQVNLCIGISEREALAGLYTVYPNPNKGEFSLKSGLYKKPLQLNIFNALGQTVFSQMISAGETQIKTGLITGVYFYTISGNEKIISSGKLIIE